MNRVYVLLITIFFHLASGEAQVLAKWTRKLVSTGLSVGINPLNPNTVYAQTSSGTFVISYDGGKTWQAHGNLPVQQVREFLVHPADTSVILCAAFDGGLHRTTDGGITWTTVIPVFGIDGESIALNPVHPDTIFAGDYSTTDVYRSSDRGASWTRMGTIGGSICAFVVRPDSTNILFAGAGSGRIAKSMDQGATWHLVKPQGSEEIPKIVIDPLYPTMALGAAYEGPDSTEGVWRTVDGGEHWSRTSLQNTSVWSLDIDKTNPSIAYAGTFSERSATVYVTSDGGTSWVSRGSGIPPSSNLWNLKVHPLDGGIVWLALAGTEPGVYRQLSTRTIVRGIVLDDGSGDIVRNGYAVDLSTGDTTFLASSGGEFAAGLFVDDSSGTRILHVVAYPYYARDVLLSFVPDTALFVPVRLQRLPVAVIAGTVRDSLTQLPLRAKMTLMVSTTNGPERLIDTTDQDGRFSFAGQYISQPAVVRYDGIDIETEIPHPHVVLPAFSLTEAGIAFSVLLPDADVFLVCGDTASFASYYESALDSIGVTWSFWNQAGVPPLSMVQSFRKRTVVYYTGNRVSPFSEEERDSLLACAGSGGNLFITGQNIAEANDTTAFLRDVVGIRFGGNVNPLSTVSGVQGDLFPSLTFGTFGSGGANNQSSKDRLTVIGPQARSCLVYNVQNGTAAVRVQNGPGRILFMGFGFEGINLASARKVLMQRAMAYLDGSLTVDSAEEATPAVWPFRLEQNYPNPFNPATTIAYTIPNDATVSLEVYSVTGQRVLTLAEGRREKAGYHAVTFSAPLLASGVYFYTLRAGPFVETRKLVLLR